MAGLTYSQIVGKLKFQAKATESTIQEQLVQDYNIGYQQFASKLNRYWVRKQQFTDLVAGQSIYQVPVDFKSVVVLVAQVTDSFKPPLQRVFDELEWRRLVSYPQTTSWPTHFFVLGSKQIAVWPTPAEDVTLGLRLAYQPRNFNLSIADIDETDVGATATVVQGSTTITLSGAVLTTNLTGLNFQVTGVLDDTFYDIVASTSSTITIEAPYVASSASGLSWRVGQLPNLPEEYHFVPGDQALWRYFSSNGNEPRAIAHKTYYETARDEALSVYSSAGEASVITEDNETYNPWLVPPPAA